MLAQQLVNGVLLGATYALFALGFTLIFGVLRVINLTYGFYFSAGAFIALALTREAGLAIALALPLATIAAGLLAIVLDSLLLPRLRLRRTAELDSLMVTLGAVLALYSVMTAWLGPDIRRFPPGVISAEAVEFLGLRVTLAQGLILLASFVLVAALMGELCFWGGMLRSMNSSGSRGLHGKIPGRAGTWRRWRSSRWSAAGRTTCR